MICFIMIFLICSTAFCADQTITIVIPSIYVQRVKDAFDGIYPDRDVSQGAWVKKVLIKIIKDTIKQFEIREAEKIIADTIEPAKEQARLNAENVTINGE